jgi:hypothetical protein
MRRPGIGEVNLGALVGVVVGAIGGLFAVGVAPAILFRNPALLFATPLLGIISWIISGIAGWIIGGQIGPRLEERLGERNGSYIGGTIGGLVPIISIALWDWYMVAGH